MNCQLIENPKMRHGPHKMPLWAAWVRVFETFGLLAATDSLSHNNSTLMGVHCTA